jgi:predicted dehydrogenase
MLMVGFNRHFAPFALTASEQLAARCGPAVISIMVNAGRIPRDHWTQDSAIGGGRIVGEACHFLDLARFLVGAPITDLELLSARAGEGAPVDDVATMSVRFADGSIATIQYLTNGPKSYPKERVECFFDGRALAIGNWRRLQSWGSGLPRGRRSGQDKGHSAEMDAWLQAVKNGGPAPIPLDELIEESRWSIRAGEMARR